MTGWNACRDLVVEGVTGKGGVGKTGGGECVEDDMRKLQLQRNDASDRERVDDGNSWKTPTPSMDKRSVKR